MDAHPISVTEAVSKLTAWLKEMAPSNIPATAWDHTRSPSEQGRRGEVPWPPGGVGEVDGLEAVGGRTIHTGDRYGVKVDGPVK